MPKHILVHDPVPLQIPGELLTGEESESGKESGK